MPLMIDRATRLEETLVEIAKLAEQCRKDADLDQCHSHAEWFRQIKILANDLAPATTSFVKEFDPETVGDEEFRRELFAAVYAARVVQSLTETRDQVARWAWTTATIAVDEYERLAKERTP